MTEIVQQGLIENKIYQVRGMKVMLDKDLAELYAVPTKVLNQAVKRNKIRFPDNFMFRLTKNEALILRSQFVTSKRGGRRYLPYAFTEHGVLMLANVLNSERAIRVSITVIQTFMKLREMVSLHKDLAQKLGQLERNYEQHDAQIHAIFYQIREFMTVKGKPKPRIGFK